MKTIIDEDNPVPIINTTETTILLKKTDYEEHIKKHKKLVKNNRRMKLKIQNQKEELTNCNEKIKKYKQELKQRENPNLETEIRLMNIYEENKKLRKRIEILTKETEHGVKFADKIWDTAISFNVRDLTPIERVFFNNLMKEMELDLND